MLISYLLAATKINAKREKKEGLFKLRITSTDEDLNSMVFVEIVKER